MLHFNVSMMNQVVKLQGTIKWHVATIAETLMIHIMMNHHLTKSGKTPERNLMKIINPTFIITGSTLERTLIYCLTILNVYVKFALTF